jgi:hypothetical protein
MVGMTGIPGRRTLPIIGLISALVMPGYASDILPDTPVFPPIDPSQRPPAPERLVEPHSLRIEEFAPADTVVDLWLPTHIAFVNGLEIISEVTNDRLSYRVLGSASEWQTSPLAVNGPHAVAFSPTQQLFYCADTENHRVLSFSRLDDGDSSGPVSIAGVALQRPHDILYDPTNGFVYVVNPGAPVVLRFSAFGVDEMALDLSHVAGGYSRGLSLVDGKILLAASTQGLVIEIDDFETGEVTVHESYGKIEAAQAGSWETTGFIPNDIEYYDGYWYLSNFFHPGYASGTDHNRFKLVRFRTWNDLASGQWEELSHFLPDAQIPYFFTVDDGHLYMAGFGSGSAEDAVYRITSGLFFDAFESGDLGAWAR